MMPEAGKRNVLTAAVAVALAAAPTPAWEIDADAPKADLEAFHRAFAAAVYAYPGHGATPLGVAGWDVSVALSVAPDFENEPGVAATIGRSLTGNHLSIARAGVRKGLPGGFDLGLSYAQVLEGDLDLLTGELEWAWLEGSAVSPAFGVRATATRASGSASYDLDQIGLELLASKGFTVLSIYGGAGVVRSEGRFSPTAAPSFGVDDSHGILYAGAVLDVLIPKVALELQSAEQVTGTIRVSFGF